MKLAKNSLLSLLPTLAGIAASILTVPVYIAEIGNDRYGALLVGLVLLGYFGQADFGLGRALTQRLSAERDADATERASIVWSALAGALGISIIGAGLICIAAYVFFAFFFEATDNLRAEAIGSVWLFGLCVPVIMYTGVSTGALLGAERFGVVSVGTMVGNLLSQVLPLAMAVLHSSDLSWLLGASLAGRVIGLLLIVASMWRVFLRGQPVIVSRKQLRRLFAFGVWIMVTAIIGPLMIVSDRVVIGATIGASAVVAYSVPFLIAQRTITFPLAIVNALFPRLAAQTEEQSAALGKVSVVLVGQLYAFVVAGLICLAEPLLQLWLGDKLDERSILVGQIALIGFWINALANVPYALIQARGNSRFTAMLHVIELPLYFATLYGLGLAMGLTGIALAFTLRTTLDCGVLFQKARFAGGDVLGKLIGPAAVVLAPLVASSLLDSWINSLAAASACSLVLLALSWFQMPQMAKTRLIAQFARMSR